MKQKLLWVDDCPPHLEYRRALLERLLPMLRRSADHTVTRLSARPTSFGPRPWLGWVKESFPPVGIPRTDRLQMAIGEASPTIVVTLSDAKTIAPYACLLHGHGATWVAVQPHCGLPLSDEERMVANMADAVVCTTEASRDAITSAHVQTPTRVAPWPFDAATVEPLDDADELRDRAGLNGEFTIGSRAVGREAREFVASLRSMEAETSLLLGVGNRADADLDGCANCHVVPLPRGAGESATRKRSEFYSLCDVYVRGTLTDGVAAGVLEAMAAGLPVIAPDVPVLRELIGDSGMLTKSVEEVVEGLNALREEPALRRKLGEAARARAEEVAARSVVGEWRRGLLQGATLRLPRPSVMIVSLMVWGATGGGQRPQKLAEAMARRGLGVVHVQEWVSPPTALPPGVATLGYTDAMPGGLLGDPGKATFDEFWRRLDDLCPTRPSVAIICGPSIATLALAKELRRQDMPIVYDVLDDWEEFDRLPGHRWYSKAAETELVDLADKITVVSPILAEKFSQAGAVVSPNALDWDTVTAPRGTSRPADMPRRGAMTIGYIGSLSGEWHDWDTVREVALAKPRWRIVLIGPDPSFLPSNLVELSNVTALHAKPHSEVPRYIDCFDVGIIPFKHDALSKAVSPIKAYDYLARGCPVVSSPMSGVEDMPNVLVAASVDEWIQAIHAASKIDRTPLTHWLSRNTWDARIDDFALGERFAPNASRVPSSMRQRFRSAHRRPDQTRMRVDWQMSGACDYACPYCTADRSYHKMAAKRTLRDMQAAWTRFNHEHGPCQVTVSGLEPMCGQKNVRMLAWLSQENMLEIRTNLSFPSACLKGFKRPENVLFEASYHASGGVSVGAFIRKIDAVREMGFDVARASAVCYPPSTAESG